MHKNLLSSSFKYREQDPSFVGDDLDPSYSRGPVEQRKCTDLFCCLLFLVMLAGMVFVGVIGFKTGDPQRLAAPFDEDGNQCGTTTGYEDYQKIFISFMNQDPTDVGFVCVKTCPLNSTSTIDCKTTSKVPSCSDLKIYEADTVVNLCYPSAQIIAEFDFDYYMDISTLQKYFSDLKVGWPLLCICAGFALVVSIIFTLFIRFCAGCFVWSSIVLFWGLMVGIGTCSFLIHSNQFLQNLVNYANLPTNLRDQQYQLTCAIICWVLAFLQTIIVCCCLKQIRISIGILKAAADFTREQCYAFLIPLYITLLQILFFAAWAATLLFIFSSSESEIEPVAQTPFGFVVFNRNIQLYSILYLFGLLWVIFFLEAMGDYWTCSSVAIWYFEQGNPYSPIFRSIKRSFKQVGSLAMGSLVVAIVVFIRVMLQYFTKLLKHKTMGIQQQAAPAKFALKCASCCIACFQRIIRFLTKNAYVMMAISGKSFCESAQQSFYLMLKSTTQFAISHGTTKVFIAFGKLTIVAICCLSGYFFLVLTPYYQKSIYSPVFLTILFAIVSYPIASAFLMLFDMASNTILMCYCLQLELAKGSNSKCPRALLNFLRNYVRDSSSVTSSNALL